MDEDVIKKTPDRLHTIVFDQEDEYIRFMQYVDERFGGAGIELTNVPIAASIRIKSWLFELTREQFSMRLVSEQDLNKVRKQISNRKPFDPKNLDDFRVPGVSKPRR